MNTINRFLIFACVTFLSLACTRIEEPLITEPEGIEVTITATREGYNPSTKTILANGTHVEWCPMEEISVFCNDGSNGGSKFVSQNSEQVAIAEFKGRLEGIVAGGEDFTDGKYLYGIYPYSSITSLKNGIVTLSLSPNQSAVEGTFANNLFPTIARAQSMNLAFYNVCGGVKFTVSRDDITSVTFKGNNGERVAGTANVNFDEESGLPVILEENAGSEYEITLNAPEGGLFKPGKEYYMVAYPVELSAGFTMIFRTSEMKEGCYVKEGAVEIQRGTFGTLDKPDESIASWTDITSGGGGFNSGIYLGIMGFNQQLYPYPISELTGGRKIGFDNFIDDLTMKNGTLLYYSVEQALNTMQSAQLPDDISTVAIVTFTDGLDQGSLMMNDSYRDNAEYLDTLNKHIMNDSVAGVPITAYSIGIRGQDVADVSLFRDNLKKLASSADNATEVTSMAEVNQKFKEIAEQLSKTNNIQTINLKVPGVATGTLIRFTFDNVKSAEASTLYIEGTFNLSERSLENVTYNGLTSTSGTVIKGTADGIFINFTFEGVHTDDNTLIDSRFTDEWTYIESNNIWQINSEFDKNEVSAIVTERSSAVIMLVLDCSSSLANDFSTAQNNAKDFINTLYSASGGNENSGQNPGGNDNTIYSTTPKDLHLAIWKEGKRYYLSEEEYDKANLSDVIIEGLTVVSAADTFIVSLNDLQSGSIRSIQNAMSLYESVMPTYEQGSVISAKWIDINDAMSKYGGVQLSTSVYYYTSSTSSDNYYDFTNCIHGSGGTLVKTDNYPYIRGAKSIENDQPINWVDPNDLKLAVQINGARRFLSNEEYVEWKDKVTSIEGVTLIGGGEKFIVHLNDAQTGSISSIETAMSLYSGIMPTGNQGMIISAKLMDLNDALRFFGGTAIEQSRYYYTTNTEPSSSWRYTYCIHEMGGGLYNTNQSPYVRGVTVIQ